MPNAKIDNEWCRCAKCGHKLGKRIGDWGERSALPALEIKCPSCKELNYILMGKGRQSAK